MTRKSSALQLKQFQRGFTLVEGLVATALVVFGFMAVSSLFPTGYSNITYSGNQTLAANYAQQKIEQLKNLSFDSIDANCSNDPPPEAGFSLSCLLTTNVGVTGSLSGDLKKVQVTVTWPGGARPGSSVVVETLFTRQ